MRHPPFRYRPLAAAVLAALLLSACGGEKGAGSHGPSGPEAAPEGSPAKGGDIVGVAGRPGEGLPGSASPPVRTAVLLDGVVEGARYESEGGPSGVTDRDGVLRYVEGRPVRILVGDVDFGSALPVPATEAMGDLAASMVVTPLELAGAGDDIDAAAVVNRVRLLMTLDDDGDPDNGIRIDPLVGEALAALPTPAFDIAEGAVFDTDYIVARANAARGANAELVAPDVARAHFCDSLGRADCDRGSEVVSASVDGVAPVIGGARPIDGQGVEAVSPVVEAVDQMAPGGVATGNVDPAVGPGVDVVPETVSGAAPGVVPDIVTELAPDVAPEVVPDVVPEAVPDVSPEVTPDTTPEVVSETSPDGGSDGETAESVETGENDEPEPVAVNAAPLVTGVAPSRVAIGERWTFAPTVSDADGDAVALALENAPSWMELDPATNTVAGTPVAADVGLAEGIVLVADDGADTGRLGPFAVEVFQPNRAPVLAGDPPASIDVGVPFAFTPVATDADGDALLFSAEGLPDWLSVDPLDGALSGTPAAGDVGNVAGIAIGVTDGEATGALPPFDLLVVQPNRAPVLDGLPALAVLVGEPWAFEPSSEDADGDALVFSAENLPAWASVDAATGRLSGTPSAVGPAADIVLVASDGELETRLAPFTVSVLAGDDLAPSGTARQGSTYRAAYPAAAVIDGDPDTFNHTDCRAGEDWWQLDLGREATLSRLVIDNRDGNRWRLDGASVRLGDTARPSGSSGTGASTDEITDDGVLVATLDDGARQEIVLDAPRRARYVTVETAGGNCLHLANVAAFGRLPDEPIFGDAAMLLGAVPPVAAGDAIGRVVARDAQGDALVYRVVGDAPFAVDADGLVRATAALDHNRVQRHDFDVVVSDGRHEARAAVTVRLLGESGVTLERWLDLPGTAVADLESDARYPDAPDVVATLPALDQAGIAEGSYGERLTAFLVPDVSGDYELAVVGDDATRLDLSPTDDVAEAATVAAHGSWSSYRNWSAAGRSDPIRLEAGRVHAIRAFHKEGGGSDHVSVGWRRVGESEFLPIPGGRLFTGFLDEAGSRPIVDAYDATHLFANAVAEGHTVLTLASRDAQGDALTLSIDADVPFAVDADGRVTVSGPLEPGTTYAFVVNVDDGTHVVAAPITIRTTESDAVADALARGDASDVTERELADALYAARDGHAQVAAATLDALAGDDQSSPARDVGPLDWNPTHASVVLEPLALGGAFPVLISNHSVKRAEANEETLAVAGIDGGSRYLAFGGNPIHDLARGDASGGTANAAMQTYLENAVRWLTGRDDPDAGELDVVVAHLDDSYWGRHDDSAHGWLSATWPGANVNDEDACESAALAACLAGAELLVIGGEQGASGTDGHGVTFDLGAVLGAFDAARAAGVPVLYLHRGWDTTSLSRELLRRLGVTASLNYFGQDALLGYPPGAAIDGATDSLERLVASVRTIDSGRNGFDYAATDACTNYVGRITCHADRVLGTDGKTLDEHLVGGIDALSARLSVFDADDTDVFSLGEAYRPTQLAVLLADKYREGVRFPLDKLTSEPVAFHRSLFADAGVHYARSNNPMQPDMGLFTDAQQALNGASPVTRRVERAPTAHAGWFSTGLYAPPGRALVVRRTDDLDTTVRVRANMLRNTTRHWNANGYSRPRHLASESITVPAGGSITFSTPHGGPVYLWLGADASTDPAEVSVVLSGVLDNPLLDAFDEVSIAAFSDELLTTDSDWVDISTPYAEVHSLKSHMSAAFAAQDGDRSNGYTSADVSDYLADLDGYMIKGNYAFAGFASEDLGPLPTSVADWCTSTGLASAVYDGAVVDLCRDTRIHALPRLQHVNSGIAAACGGLCAGNPFDSGSALSPLGWGENHEMGHNLQRNRLKFYGGRSNEVSNNLFPLQTERQWAIDEGLDRHPSQNRPSHAQAFDIVQAEIAAGTPAGIEHELWKGSGTYDYAFARLAVYIQLTYASGDWDVWTKLYVAERVFTDAVRDEATWLAVRDALGFGDYGLAAAKAIDGNDFIHVAASTIDGRDYADFLAAWGVSVSAEARAQVVANGIVDAAPVVARYVEGTLPVATPVLTIPLDGTSTWEAPAE